MIFKEITVSIVGPFTEVVTAELKLTNPSKKRICFKVKTTAPKQYCVRPNNGLIEPNGTVMVAGKSLHFITRTVDSFFNIDALLWCSLMVSSSINTVYNKLVCLVGQ